MTFSDAYMTDLKRTFRFPALLMTCCLLAGFSVACETEDDDCYEGSGILQTYEVELEDFTELRISGSADVIIRQSDTTSLRVTTDDNLFRRYTFKYKKDELHITNEGCINTSQPLRVMLTIDDLDLITLTGSSSLTSIDTLKFDDLQLVVTGTADINVDMINDELESTVSGNADVALRGECGLHTVRVRGNASINAEDYETERTIIDISGNANCRVWATDELDVKISGTGNVAYRGNPQVDSDISGVGNLTRIP